MEFVGRKVYEKTYGICLEVYENLWNFGEYFQRKYKVSKISFIKHPALSQYI